MNKYYHGRQLYILMSMVLSIKNKNNKIKDRYSNQ